jgi:hypothetical protein
MGGQSREGQFHVPPALVMMLVTDRFLFSGGKVKPLKSAKKEKKDLDEDDLAFKEKQRAGMFLQRCIQIFLTYL